MIGDAHRKTEQLLKSNREPSCVKGGSIMVRLWLSGSPRGSPAWGGEFFFFLVEDFRPYGGPPLGPLFWYVTGTCRIAEAWGFVFVITLRILRKMSDSPILNVIRETDFWDGIPSWVQLTLAPPPSGTCSSSRHAVMKIAK